MTVERVNEMASKMTIFGWFAGLAYFGWFTDSQVSLPFWVYVVLGVVGMFVASIVIGGGMALLAALVTRLVTGRAEGSLHAFSWTAFISPVLAFIAARYVLMLTRDVFT